MKNEWRKHEKTQYLPKSTPEIIHLNAMNYLTIHGEGNPNGSLFQHHVKALYALSYGIKMTLKQTTHNSNYMDYTVYPLEATWSLYEQGIEKYAKGVPITSLKDNFKYKLMIRQPDFVTQYDVDMIQKKVFEKKQDDAIKHILFEQMNETIQCQMMPIGSYDDETQSFKKMDIYIKSLGYQRMSYDHHEIYISDPRKTLIDRLKTVLRIQIQKRVL
ncbi:MAG: hypothetical protein ACPF9F_02620 [Acholeplasmataceae bacterium]